MPSEYICLDNDLSLSVRVRERERERYYSDKRTSAGLYE